MATYKNPVTNQTVSVDESQAAPYTNSGWTATADVSTPNFTSITPESLAPQPSINLPAQQPDNTNYNGMINGGAETAGAALALANKPPIQEAPKSDIQSMLDNLSGTPPPSGASLYESTYGVGPTQAEITAKTEADNKAKLDLDLLNAQMKAINAEATAIPIKVEKDYAGRASMSAIEGMSRSQLRDLALRSLPLEGQILAAQAIQTGSQRALELAQSKFDKVFELRLADQDRNYDYMKEQRAIIYDQLNKKEQRRIDAMNKADDIKREDYKNNIANLRSLANTAITNGQGDLAGQISALDPKSPTFAQDLSKLQAQIIPAGFKYVATPAERDALRAQGYEIIERGGKTYAKPKELTPIETYEAQKKIDQKYKEGKTLTISEQLAAEAAGFNIVDGKIVSKNAGIVTDSTGQSYDISSYATDPNHETAVKNLVANMGQFKTVADIDAYIKKVAPSSPITGEMIKNASDKYGGNISWETMTAIMQQDSNLGTAGAGARSFNPGNVGNTETATSTGQLVNKGSWQGGVDAVASWLNNHKATAPNADILTDPNSQSIMAQTGLSNWAFLLATQGTTALTRLSGTEKTKIGNEWRNYQIKHNIDGATFQAQYSALTKTVMANSLRNNQSGVAESELENTIINLKDAATNAKLSNLKGLNVAKIFAGKELNKPEQETYKFHLEQLRNEFAMYNAALSGQIDETGNIRQINDSDIKRAEQIIQDGFAKGSIDGFEKALKASMSKMGVVLSQSIDAQNKQVWKLFGVGDKYKSSVTNQNNQSDKLSDEEAYNLYLQGQ